MWALKGLLLCLAFAYGAYSDIKSREIPDIVPVTIFLSGFIGFAPLNACIGLAAVGAVFLLAAMLGNMGGGDVRLMAASGFALGLFGGILQTIMGLTLALLFTLGKHMITKKKSIRHTGIPLAPFLGLGGILAYLLI